MKLRGRRVRLEGDPAGPFTYLLQFPDERRRRGDVAIVHGRLRGQGVVVGLLEQGAWAGQAFVEQSGEFYAAVPVQRDGRVSLTVTNNSQDRPEIELYGAWFERSPE